MANVLLSALGASEEPRTAVRRCEGLKAGDAFLLCTDGLWRYFSDAELGAAIAMNSPRQASEMLINKARERAVGISADNCTLAIVKLVMPPDKAKTSR
ncbi:MAG: serine/threonine-protein phosphatase [Noviherbaspirillum sp.]|nr:serine/threonine-protein phosphatase [Noviherbaspirillum sp.]